MFYVYQVYRGPNTSYRLTNLSPRTEYQARVCAVRQSTSRSGDITGAFSPGTVFSTLSPVPQRTLIAKTVETKISEPKQLTDQQWAMIILCGFALFAVLLAFIAQQILSYTSHTSSRQWWLGLDVTKRCRLWWRRYLVQIAMAAAVFGADCGGSGGIWCRLRWEWQYLVQIAVAVVVFVAE